MVYHGTVPGYRLAGSSEDFPTSLPFPRLLQSQNFAYVRNIRSHRSSDFPLSYRFLLPIVIIIFTKMEIPSLKYSRLNVNSFLHSCHVGRGQDGQKPYTWRHQDTSVFQTHEAVYITYTVISLCALKNSLRIYRVNIF